MLIVGGTAALTAIAVYLAWHFFMRWRAAARLRRAKHTAIVDKRPDEAGAQKLRELVP
jgi:hypothetical protein